MRRTRVAAARQRGVRPCPVCAVSGELARLLLPHPASGLAALSTGEPRYHEPLTRVARERGVRVVDGDTGPLLVAHLTRRQIWRLGAFLRVARVHWRGPVSDAQLRLFWSLTETGSRGRLVDRARLFDVAGRLCSDVHEWTPSAPWLV